MTLSNAVLVSVSLVILFDPSLIVKTLGSISKCLMPQTTETSKYSLFLNVFVTPLVCKQSRPPGGQFFESVGGVEGLIDGDAVGDIEGLVLGNNVGNEVIVGGILGVIDG